ncbi:MAG: hypothetical protein GY941_21770 [Planctomycetes bacterium]|nr:hypothetical protein [Planctomycetota bacterium]
MKFRDLKIGQVFEFDHTGFEYSGLEPGPWRKTSSRKYIKHTNPFSADIHERNLHQRWCSLDCQVGSINVAVKELTS